MRPECDLVCHFCCYHILTLISLLDRFINDMALSCELAGYFYLKTGKKDKALQYFMQAHEKYHEWGAAAKSSALFEFVQQGFGLESNHRESVSSSASDFLVSDDECGSKVRKRGSDFD